MKEITLHAFLETIVYSQSPVVVVWRAAKIERHAGHEGIWIAHKSGDDDLQIATERTDRASRAGNCFVAALLAMTGRIMPGRLAGVLAVQRPPPLAPG